MLAFSCKKEQKKYVTAQSKLTFTLFFWKALVLPDTLYLEITQTHKLHAKK